MKMFEVYCLVGLGYFLCQIQILPLISDRTEHLILTIWIVFATLNVKE